MAKSKKAEPGKKRRLSVWHRVDVVGPHCSWIKCKARAAWKVAVPLQSSTGGNRHCFRFVCAGHVPELMEHFPPQGEQADA
jgi:hypothetical protein